MQPHLPPACHPPLPASSSALAACLPPSSSALPQVMDFLPGMLRLGLGKLAGVQDRASAEEQLRREPMFCLETGEPCVGGHAALLAWLVVLVVLVVLSESDQKGARCLGTYSPTPGQPICSLTDANLPCNLPRSHQALLLEPPGLSAGGSWDCSQVRKLCHRAAPVWAGAFRDDMGRHHRHALRAGLEWQPSGGCLQVGGWEVAGAAGLGAGGPG